MGLFFVGDNNKKNIEVILISTLVSRRVFTLVIVITIYLFWRSKWKQQYLLLQIHESEWICPCKVNFCPYWFSNQCYILINFTFITICYMHALSVTTYKLCICWKLWPSIMIKNASALSLLLSKESKILKRIVKKINIVRPQKNEKWHIKCWNVFCEIT